ncbi:MAG: M48 family metalloprotease [Patescibacteria group bacterium]
MTIYSEIAKNKRRTWLLLIIFSAVVMAIGWFWGESSGSGYRGLITAFLFSSVSAAFSYFASDKVALATHGAKKVNKQDAPRYYRIVENLTLGSGLPLPELYVIPSRALNAFATGRNPEHASVAVTSGLLQRLDNQELEGVLAHELSHIKNYDIRLMTVVVVLVGAVGILSSWFRRSIFYGSRRRNEKNSGGLLALIGLVLLLVAPIVATLIKLAISRRREFLADTSAAYITRYPEGLASALEKISKRSRLENASEATAHLFIDNPFRGSAFANLFSTHPPAEERISRLRQM